MGETKGARANLALFISSKVTFEQRNREVRSRIAAILKLVGQKNFGEGKVTGVRDFDVRRVAPNKPDGDT